jgi:hypothetical protein
MSTTQKTAPANGAARGWLTKSALLKIHQIGARHLQNLVTDGYVRSVKVDPSQQGRRVYSLDDLDSYLTAMAEGRSPAIRSGRRGRRTGS